MPKFDICIRSARLRHQADRLFQIAIRDGEISELAEEITGDAYVELDAGGGLVTESYANPHLHLCKVYTLQMIDEVTLQDYHGAGLAALYGNTHIRAFADVDSKAKLEGVKALIQARKEFEGIVNIQVVAFAQDGIVREPGAADLLVQAMEIGADIVGGIPWIEFTNADIVEHVQVIFDIAGRSDSDVSMLVDDAGDPGLRSLEVVAVEAIKRGWQGRVLAHHARAQSMYPKPYLQKLAALLKQADMGLVTDPHTGPLHARVRELLEENVLVCLGQDDISDAYYPFGRNNMLEVAFLASHLLWMTTAGEMETLYDMISVKAMQAMGLRDIELKPGAPAHLVVLPQDNVLDALRYHSEPSMVISHGKLVDKDKMKKLASV